MTALSVETDRVEIGQRVRFPGIAEPYKTGDLGEGGLYCPGLNLTVSKVWTETGRPFMMYGLNFHCRTPSMPVRAKAKEPCMNLASWTMPSRPIRTCRITVPCWPLAAGG